ncbi:MAG: polysaccharide lyase 8 family protein [Kiritimatiellia bacterium]|jgi:chondroitin AC lyase|nr:polysaccharide lyase 8 family protein [Kiritimatiellia bacterium]
MTRHSGVWGLAVLLGWGCPVARADRQQDLETVKARLLAEVRNAAPDLKKARDLIQGQRPDGSWEDIPYAAKDRMLWPPMEHLKRLTALAEAFESSRSPEAGRAALAAAFVKGFDFWVERDPTSSNWWYNQIGAVRSLYRLMLLTEPLLTGIRLQKGCELLTRAKLGMTGQNLVWLAENVIGRACLQRNAERMEEAFRRIEAEIVVTEKEGIQPDFSFHQHGAQLYSGGYGSGFAASASRFALLAQGTSFAFAPEKILILQDYLLEGQQWMIRGDLFDYSACGRELTRPGKRSVAGYAAIARTLLKLESATRREELERLAARLEKGATVTTPALTGHKHFWRSDYTVFHRPEWLVSVRMTSDRLLQTEVINEENLLGEHLADGVMYLYRTGNEYRDIFPVWDWTRLPGITAELDRPLRRIDNRRKGTQPFAGGCSDGVTGVSAMAFEREGLTAKKAWFFVGNEVVCLGADIASTNRYPVVTSVNQCLADGPVTAKRALPATVLLKTPQTLEKPAWIHHGGVGYLFFDAGESVCAGSCVQTGSWRRIATPQKPDAVAQAVFSLWITHGARPRGATYAYAVTAQENADALEAYAAAHPVRVVANTPHTQAVEQTQTGQLQIVFYRAGAVTSETWGTVSADRPCLLMLKRNAGRVRATLCDPCRKADSVWLKVGEKVGLARLPSGTQAGASATLDL